MEYDQSGVIPIRRRGTDIEVLLITSRSRGRWIVPKGNLEPDLSPHESAEVEAYEEAGVQGTVHPEAFGAYEHGDPPAHRVEVFLMEVEEELEAWPERDERRRRWVPLDEALETVDEDGLKPLLERIAGEIPVR